MAIIYSYPIAQPAITDLLLGTHVDQDRPRDGNPTKSFYISDVMNLVGTSTVSNPTAVALTLANLNTLYPNAMVGFKVQCVNLSPARIYEKTADGNVVDSNWASYNITPVL